MPAIDEHAVSDYELENANNNEILKKRINSITLEFNRPAFSHRYCFVCKKEPGPKNLFSQIHNESIVEIFIETNICIMPGSRCCRSHLVEGSRFLKREEFEKINIF